MKIRETLTEAAKAGRFDVSHTEDGADFEDIFEWIEYASDADLEDAAIKAGLMTDGAADIHKIMAADARRRAGNCSSLRFKVRK